MSKISQSYPDENSGSEAEDFLQFVAFAYDHQKRRDKEIFQAREKVRSQVQSCEEMPQHKYEMIFDSLYNNVYKLTDTLIKMEKSFWQGPEAMFRACDEFQNIVLDTAVKIWGKEVFQAEVTLDEYWQQKEQGEKHSREKFLRILFKEIIIRLQKIRPKFHQKTVSKETIGRDVFNKTVDFLYWQRNCGDKFKFIPNE